MRKAEVIREPEGVFYFARHCGMVNDAEAAVDLVRRARLGGLWSSKTLERDIAFAGVRHNAEFQREAQEARGLGAKSQQALREALGSEMMKRWGFAS